MDETHVQILTFCLRVRSHQNEECRDAHNRDCGMIQGVQKQRDNLYKKNFCPFFFTVDHLPI